VVGAGVVEATGGAVVVVVDDVAAGTSKILPTASVDVADGHVVPVGAALAHRSDSSSTPSLEATAR
jgi:hypothetical protein